MASKKESKVAPTKDGKKDVLEQMSQMHNKLQDMLGKDEPLPPLLDRPDLKPRWVAVLIDGFAAAIVIFLFTTVGMLFNYTLLNLFMIFGAVVATMFMLIRDGIYKSASPGKFAVGLRVVDEEGHFIGITTSAKRNLISALPFAVIVIYGVLNIFSEFIGGLVMPLVGILGLAAVAAGGFEVYNLLKDRETSRRLGDHQAGTKVIELDD
jgi:uncharacterized RDD family membrane protein YckC